MAENLILASASPVRRRLLEATGLCFEVVPSTIDEYAVRRALAAGDEPSDPADIAEVLARAKAEDVSLRHPGACVIGADQILELDGRIFEKPRDMAAARATLHALSGRDHDLHCAVTLAGGGEVTWARAESATLHMRPLSIAEIEGYLARTGTSVLQSVGAYQLEGLGLNLFDRIEGDYFTILGMPLLSLLEELRSRGLAPW